MFYQIIKAKKEDIGIVWEDKGNKPQIRKIYLPAPKNKLVSLISRDFSAVEKKPHKIEKGMDRLIAGLYLGEKQKITLSALNMQGLKPFAARVLKMACKIPRGKAATYSGLAAKLGKPGAARAVGAALANNPFPIIIPCHRVVRADGSLGGFGGGLGMKREMLEREGVELNLYDRISPKYII